MASTTLTDRAIIRLSGEGVREFLQGLVTVDIHEVTARSPKWGALLSAQGKCLFDFVLWGYGETPDGDVFIDCEASAARQLAQRLAIYKLRRAISINVFPEDAELGVHWGIRPPATFSSANTFGASCDPRLPELGFRWLDRKGDPADAQWREHRLRLGVCEGSAELGDLLWLECNAAELNGVSFTKGCFVGQENTARMNWRSKVNRRLVVVESAEQGPRTRVVYPDLGLAVEHRRVDDLAGAILPDWLMAAVVA